MSRPETLVVVVGTGTEIGKTWVGARLCAHWYDQGARVAARKPVQSFDPRDDAPLDAEVLAAATGEDPSDVCAPDRSLPVPLAPPMATDALGMAPIHVADLLDELRWPEHVDIGLVETVGGVRAPIAEDADSTEFARALDPDHVVLVANAGLGTVSHVRLAVACFPGVPLTVVLNRFDATVDVHVRNAKWLTEREHLHVVYCPTPGWEAEVLGRSAGAQPGHRESGS